MDGRAIEPRREGSKKTASKKAPRVYLHVRSGRPVEHRTTPLHPVPRTGNGCRRECAAARSRVVVVLEEGMVYPSYPCALLPHGVSWCRERMSMSMIVHNPVDPQSPR